MEQVAIGFVGAGGVATRHAETLAGFEDVRLVGVADPDVDAARRLAERAGTAAYTSHEELLARERPDAVYVCVPPFAHGDPELAVVEAGLPLFVEKPLAADLATAERIAEAVRRRGLVTAVGYHWRWLDTLERARELLDGNPARLVLAYWLDKVPPPAWWQRRDRSGGQIVEQATHVLDLARALVGEVTQVHALGARTERPDFPGSDVDDVSAASLRFSTGAVGTVAATCLLGRLHRAGLHLFADGLALELSETELVVERDGVREVHAAGGDARGRPDRDFIDAVNGGPDRVRVPYAEALRTHRLACALASAAAGGRVIELTQEAPEAPRPTEPATKRDSSQESGRESEREIGREIGRHRRVGPTLPAGTLAAAPDRALNLVMEAAWDARLVPEPVAKPGEGEFLVETTYSGLSAGTELAWFKGTNPYLHAAWDEEAGVFRSDRSAAGYPVTRIGYMEVGRVAESRAPSAPEGALVAMAYGHRTAYLAKAGADRHVRLPDDLDPLLGIYVAHMGPICANGLLHAAAEERGAAVDQLGDGVRGRHVLVTGSGVVGLLVALFAREHGAADVVVADRTPERLATAAALGLATMEETPELWVGIKERWRHGPKDRGADVAFQCRGQVASLAAAMRCLRPQGTVVDLAFYQGGADALRLGEEFHHNGLTVRCAQIGRVPRGLGDRWDRDRLSAETVALLEACGREIREHLVTDVVPLTEAPALLAAVAERRRHVMQAVFTTSGTANGGRAGGERAGERGAAQALRSRTAS